MPAKEKMGSAGNHKQPPDKQRYGDSGQRRNDDGKKASQNHHNT
jgi:hypothetical protein